MSAITKRLSTKSLPRKIKEKKGTLNVTKERRSMKDPQGYALEKIYPTNLKKEARSVFDQLFPKVNVLEILREEDMLLFGQMCNAFHEYDEVNRMINGEYLVTGQKDNLVRNPLMAIRKDAQKEASDLAKLFCLTPVIRAGANLRTPNSGDEKGEGEFDDI